MKYSGYCKKRLLGFTLIEMLIVLMVISILSALVYPVYRDHLIKARRTYAMVALMDVAGKLEEYYAIHHVYTTVENLHVNRENYEKYYSMDIKAKDGAYTVYAIPKGKQAEADVFCGVLSIDQNGNRYISGVGAVTDCWH